MGALVTAVLSSRDRVRDCYH